MAGKTVKNANQALEQKVKNPVSRNKPTGLKGTIAQMENQIRMAVAKTPIDTDRFMRSMYTALSANPKLGACTQESFLGAMMAAAQLGLEPNTARGQAYLIPYKDKVQFIIGYKGLIDLAYRSGRVESVDAQTVYENDFFEYELGWNKNLKHVPLLNGDRGKPIAFYATFHMVGGGGNFFVMSVEDARNYAKKYSPSYRSGPWKDNFEQMAQKTCIRQVLKYAPLSVEIAQAVVNDGVVKEVDISKVDENFNVLDQEPEFEVVDPASFQNNPELSGNNPEKSRINYEGSEINPETGEILSDTPAMFADAFQNSFINEAKMEK